MSKIKELSPISSVETGHAPSMQTERYQNKYRISTARHIHHDYNNGGYFITICTKDRLHSLGYISLNTAQEYEMHLSNIGQYADEVIKQVSQHHSYAEIPLYVIMPNHIHLIVIICNNTIATVETGHAPSMQTSNKKMQSISTYKGKLSVTIGNIKSAITKYANEHQIPFAWQTRFYDHIIRNQKEMNEIVEYIEFNIPNWGIDELNNEAE